MKREGKINFEQMMFVFVISILLVSTFVFAARVVTTSAGATTKSINEDVTAQINITLNNTDIGSIANITQINISLYNNFIFLTSSNDYSDAVTSLSTGSASFVNTSNLLSWTNRTYLMNGTGATNGTVNFWFNVTAINPGTYNISIQTTNMSVSLTTNITLTVNDTTAPNVTITYPGNVSYHTTTSINYNLTVVDNNRTEVCYYHINGTGATNASFSNTSVTAFNATNSSIADGSYILEVFCNDSANNLNKSMRSSFIIDNVNPVLTTFTCTPASVLIGQIVTCICGVSDALSGINSTTFTANPTTATAGTFTETCTFKDRAGNSNSATATYAVTSGSSTSGGGGGGSSYSNTIVQDYKEFSEMETYTKSIKKNTKIRLKINGGIHNVGVTKLTDKTATVEVFSIPQTATLNVGDEKKFDVDADGYYDLSVKLNKIESNKADLTLNSIKEKISTPAPTTTDTTTGTPAARESPEVGEIAAEEGSLTWLWILIGVVGVGIVGVGYFVKKKK